MFLWFSSIFFRASIHSNSIGAVGELISGNDVDASAWFDDAERVMVNRFFEERRNNQFGLYVGDTNSGDIHIDEQNYI